MRSHGSDLPFKEGRWIARPKRPRLGSSCNLWAKWLHSYIFRRTANESQKPILTELLDPPPPVWAWCFSVRCLGELVTLPILAVQMGEEFYANCCEESSVFGAIISERRFIRWFSGPSDQWTLSHWDLKGFSPLVLPKHSFHQMEISQNQQENHGNMWRCTMVYHDVPPTSQEVEHFEKDRGRPNLPKAYRF